LLVAESEQQVQSLLLRELGETFRVQYQYILSEVIQDVIEGFYEDFAEGELIARRTVTALRRAELSLFQEGECIAALMTQMSNQAVNLLLHRDSVPYLQAHISQARDARTLLHYDLQGIQDYLTYNIHEGIRDLLGKAVKRIEEFN
jgi:hypothetical protein